MFQSRKAMTVQSTNNKNDVTVDAGEDVVVMTDSESEGKRRMQ